MSRYVVHGEWRRVDDDAGLQFFVQCADALDKRTGDVWPDGAYRVVDSRTGRPAVRGKGGTHPFYGETAWSDALRLATDLYFDWRLTR